MKTKPVLSLAFLFTIVHTPLLAQENTTDPVIVTATRIQSDTSQLPANITIITAEDIQSSPASTLPDILSLEAGVNSRSLYGNNAARSTIDMRGFGAAGTRNTLILLDGRRLNPIDLSEIDYTAIPLNNIERIEIIRGGSVLYGDGAVGGAINIITKQGSKTPLVNHAKLTLGSYNSHQLEGIIRHANGPFSINVSANALESDGYRENNKITQQNLQADARWSIPDGEFFIKGGFDNQYMGLPGVRTVQASISLDELGTDRRGTGNSGEFAKQDGYFVTTGISKFINSNSELVVDLGYRHKNQQSYTWQWGDTNLDTLSFTPRLKIEFGSNMQHTVTTGIDIYSSDYLSYRAQRQDVAPAHTYKAKQTNIAVYAHNLTKVTNKTNITSGARLQTIKMEASDYYNASAPAVWPASQAPSLKISDNEHMLELGIRHQLNKTVSLFGKLERSTRLGTLDEILDTGNSIFSPLKPQTATHFDTGFSINRGNHALQASAYYMRLRNEIHYDSGTFSNVNLDPTKRYGLEVSANSALGERLKVTANYAYTRSKFTEGNYTGNEVPVVSKNTASLAASWAFSSNVNATAAANYIGSKYFDNDQQNSLFKIPAYTTVDLKLNSVWSKWQIEGAVHNLLDEKAFDYGVKSTFTPGRYNAYPLPERNFSLSVSRSF
ncbi:MAG: TonB-dependent receptor [Gammaproteobacteria bacterium]|nr:TonB-dependent receptor [Gammaproteobacteria bacterium]